MFLSPLVITIFLLQTLAAQQCCQQLNQLTCIKCPENMHLYRNNCIYNIPNCLEYLNGFECSKCEINYQLVNSACQHIRLVIDPQRISNFTPYMQSAIKPNVLFNQALEILSNNTVVWSDWLQQVGKNHNESSSGKRDSSKEALMLQKRIMNSKKSLLYYIYSADYTLNGIVVNIFRLTYELANPPGFADVLIAIQSNEGKVDYLQIVQVRINDLKSQGWKQLPIDYQVKVERQLIEIFPEIDQQLLLKGWWRPSEKGYNFTLFQVDDLIGVISYSYTARNQDVQSMGLNLTIPYSQTSAENSSEVIKQQSVVNQTKGQNSKNHPVRDKIENPTFNQTKSSQAENTNKSSITNNVNTTKDTEESQMFLEVSSFDKNENLLAGYITAVKFHYVSTSSLLQGASVFLINNTYCLYFLQNSTHFRLMYRINTTKPIFQVISFSSSNKSWIANSSSANASNNTKYNNNLDNTSNNSESKNGNSKTNNTNFNSTAEVNKKSQSFNSTTNIIAKKDNSTSIPETKSNTTSQNTTTSGSTNTSSQNSTTECAPTRSTSIDITNQISEDAYMPKINLLLTKMYADTLQDARIGEASYSWSIDVKTKVSSLTYNIIYLTSLNQYYQFQVQIVNNQIKFTKTPSNIKQSGTTVVPPKTKVNVTATVPATPENKSTEIQPQNETKPNSVSDVKEVTSASNNSKTNSFLQDSLKNITLEQQKIPDSATSSQNNLSSEQQKADSSQKADNNSTGVVPQTLNNSLLQNNSRSIVSQSDYLENPKYKPIVDIACMIKKVPANATLSRMQEWTVNEESYYYILLTMNLSNPFNGSSQKLFNFQIKVNSNSYVTIVSYNVSYCCTQKNKDSSTSRDTGTKSPSKPTLLKSIGGIVQFSPYSNYLIDFMRQSSTGLSKMSVQMVSFDPRENYSDFSDCFSQKLRFKDSAKVLCYEVNYCVVKKQGTSVVHVLNYYIIGCSKKDEDTFLYKLVGAKFAQTQTQNQELNECIFRIYNNKQITFNHYKKYSNFYFVKYYQSLYGNSSILYDSNNKVLLSFYQNPATGTFSNKLFSQQLSQTINVQVKKTFGLKKGTFEVFLVQRINFSDQLSLLSVYVAEKVNFWGAEISHLYFMQAKYDQSQPSISVLNHQLIQSNKFQSWQVNNKIIPKMYQIPLRTVINNTKFAELMNQINLNYQSFMQVGRLQAILISSQSDLQLFLNNSLTNETTIKIILAKQYDDNHYGSYVITVIYNSTAKKYDFKGIQVVSSEVIKVTNCQENSQQLGLPTCATCNQGYKLVNGKCIPQISGCQEYYESSCIRCTSGQVSNFLDSCQKMTDSYGSLLASINTYLLEFKQNP